MEMIAARSGGTRYAHGGSCGYAPCWSPACPRPPRNASRAAGRRRAPDGTTPAAKQETARGALPGIAGVSLAASAWVGSGKQCRDQVWFQVGLGIRDFGKSSCRVMREKNPRALLSRRGRGQETPESGIITRAAVFSRGTEVVRVISALVGRDWKFAATRHRIIGHACRQRGRPAPLLPFSGGVARRYGSTCARAARGSGPADESRFPVPVEPLHVAVPVMGLADTARRRQVVLDQLRWQGVQPPGQETGGPGPRPLRIRGLSKRRPHIGDRWPCRADLEAEGLPNYDFSSFGVGWRRVHPSPLAINMRPGK